MARVSGSSMRTRGAAAGALGLAAGAVRASPAPAPVVPEVARRLDITRGCDSATGVALTFDDGPHPEATPAVLAALAARGAVATFFLVGEQVRRHPALARAIADAGHGVELHGERHRVQLRLTARQVREDLARGTDTLAEATGWWPRRYRPPLGMFSRAGLAATRAVDLEPQLWTRWGRDWSARASPGSIARQVARDLAPGDVLLLHDSDAYADAGCWRATVAALPEVLDRIAAAGLATVTV